jgi:hypothetical protein
LKNDAVAAKRRSLGFSKGQIAQRSPAADDGLVPELGDDLADRYSISEREIFALLTKEADAACINYLD